MTHLCKSCSTVRVELQRVKLDSGGYAHKGRDYYGTGEPVWEYTAHVPYQDQTTGEWDTREKYGSLRAPNLASAKTKIRAIWSDAKFGRA